MQELNSIHTALQMGYTRITAAGIPMYVYTSDIRANCSHHSMSQHHNSKHQEETCQTHHPDMSLEWITSAYSSLIYRQHSTRLSEQQSLLICAPERGSRVSSVVSSVHKTLTSSDEKKQELKTVLDIFDFDFGAIVLRIIVRQQHMLWLLLMYRSGGVVCRLNFTRWLAWCRRKNRSGVRFNEIYS